MTLHHWESAFLADAQGRPEQLSALVRDEPMVPVEYKERLALRLKQTPIRALGRPKAPRNADGATDRISALVASYETFWRSIEAGSLKDDAAKAARALCNTTETEFAKLIDNKITAVNEITRKHGTFRERPQKRFLEYSKD